MKMGLYHQPFMAIKDGTKKIEVRLNDEKRSQLRVGDEIEFTDLDTAATIRVEVLALEKFSTFKELFAKYSGKIIGSPDDESITDLDQENQKIYSKIREEKYGALAIRIQLLGGYH
ncbi:ASCH domain-containing protein [Companilactobacillus sp. HBUAS56257]|uniref:ASCH domain-containing protein n=1 Tax=Companilactobacillus sp. HBUAS56257 TaxID=3109360 RepID=UPI002FF26BBE